MKAARKLFRVLLVLWAGSLWSVAAWVAPLLFFGQPKRPLAVALAGRLFAIECYLGIAVALSALWLSGREKFLYLYLAAALLAVNEWALRPLMSAAHAHGAVWGLTFGAWHAAAAVLYAIACLAALLLIWKNDLR